MAGLLTRAAVLTWLALIVATLATFWLAESHELRAPAAVTIVLLIALFKARLVVLHYMGLKHAPRAWRIAFEAWVAVVPLVILGLWFRAGVGACS